MIHAGLKLRSLSIRCVHGKQLCVWHTSILLAWAPRQCNCGHGACTSSLEQIPDGLVVAREAQQVEGMAAPLDALGGLEAL